MDYGRIGSSLNDLSSWGNTWEEYLLYGEMLYGSRGSEQDYTEVAKGIVI